jgi:FixJ family two-component response regulator
VAAFFVLQRQTRRAEREGEAVPEQSQGRVHIVDDDASLRVAMGRCLTQAGHTVTTCATAQHLLDNLPTSDERGCIILDVRMPDLGGLAVQQRLAELGSTMPIIFITGYSDIPATVKALKAGALDFLTKPVASDDLLHVVEKALRHHQALLDQRGTLESIRARLATLTPRERQVLGTNDASGSQPIAAYSLR